MCSSVFQLLGCLLREAVKRASEDLEASHDGAVRQQHQVEKDHKELQFQYGDQSEGLALYWKNVTNFPVLSADRTVAAAPATPCKETWADVVRKSASATQHHSVMAERPKVTEAETANEYPPLPITAGASTRASTETVDAQVKRRSVHAPALVGGVWMHHKVTKTRRAAVPLRSAAFEQSPASDCGPPDACGVASEVSPQSEGVVLRKGSSAAHTSASSLRGEEHVEEQEAALADVRKSNKKGRSKKNVGASALVGGVSIHHKVTKTGRAAVPLRSAAFEQSPASDCGPPDACGAASEVSPQSEGVVLRKGSSAAHTSASSLRGEEHVEEQEAALADVRKSNKKGRSKKNVGASALVGDVSIHHKVTKTGRAAVPLRSAAFEQSPASDCGPPDAYGAASEVEPPVGRCGSAQGQQCGSHQRFLTSW
ncbi:hypothetical protein MTO96_052155 [Rhipicephalus appendiculatus]